MFTKVLDALAHHHESVLSQHSSTIRKENTFLNSLNQPAVMYFPINGLGMTDPEAYSHNMVPSEYMTEPMIKIARNEKYSLSSM